MHEDNRNLFARRYFISENIKLLKYYGVNTISRTWNLVGDLQIHREINNKPANCLK